ncbi:YdcF family protein [Agromyces salentinus]|uniref:YdcF family protein n=1 Tax=Agromyces salentinus TaxID=269421 RepID=UPI0014797798|nr:ElyC/SanA/YdcF family protein [Agromyces salentinus]
MSVRATGNPVIRRRLLIALVSLLGAAALVAGIGAPVYVFPPVAAVPERADAVFILGPARAERFELARQLIDDGVVDRMVVSVPADVLESPRETGRYRNCNLPGGDVTCVDAEPSTTRGEARMLASLAAEQGWERVIVITRTPHIVRTRVLFDRCFDGDLAVIDSREPITLAGWAREYAYQTAAFAKVLTTTEC